MAFTSQITAQPVFGSNPSGFVALIPANGGDSQYIASVNYDRSYDYSGITFTSGDVPQTKDDFLAMVKLDLDTNLVPTVFTDATIDYEFVYTITSIKLDFETLTSDRTIFSQRFYKYFVGVKLAANIDV